MNRRDFLKLGALFVPAAAVDPRRVYSFLWAPRKAPGRIYQAHEFELLFNGIPIEHGADDYIIVDKDGYGSLSSRLPPRLRPYFGDVMERGLRQAEFERRHAPLPKPTSPARGFVAHGHPPSWPSQNDD